MLTVYSQFIHSVCVQCQIVRSCFFWFSAVVNQQVFGFLHLFALHRPQSSAALLTSTYSVVVLKSLSMSSLFLPLVALPSFFLLCLLIILHDVAYVPFLSFPPGCACLPHTPALRPALMLAQCAAPGTCSVVRLPLLPLMGRVYVCCATLHFLWTRLVG